MTKKILIGLALIFAISCNKEDKRDKDNSIKQESGNVWISGGLAVCAVQIHLDNGDVLIPNVIDVISFSSGDKVSVRYREIGINEFCSPRIDCKIIEIKKVK